jgi:hypothetical protein
MFVTPVIKVIARKIYNVKKLSMCVGKEIQDKIKIYY